ncbi:glycosyltransferase family 2 protein [Peribacillus loiseleuriae]|uniref:Glycosyltransferase 2-like domain-containing protein n=1 Tax=Peribacillus loiseleuriae TaxID=1679170 RepID=A0A0K9GXR3_9BACI|nr:glycosyltransferase [Peribacillus loiseleuriae]KMY51042.1 hypothetical protein AC625_17155 [Peribacillus loiseleuriae]
MLDKQNFDFIFVVLTYRNTTDLKNLLNSIKDKVKDTYKIVVVNSYYNETSYNELYKIATENNCDFLNVENKGYGYGNNRGIEYVKSKYQFKYLIVSNPDIEITYLSLKELKGLEEYIIAPTIKTLSGKNQNPYYYSKIDLVEWLMYRSMLSEKPAYFYMGVVINKLYREISLFIDKCLSINKRKIYAAHGSFIIFGFNALSRLDTLYDEKMFLFCEENHLAQLALEKSIKTYMVPEIKVLHKEDGSVSYENKNILKYRKESFIVYYENWNKK